jgi:hypothetical protein
MEVTILSRLSLGWSWLIVWVQNYSLVLWSMSSHSNRSEKVCQRVCLGKRISTPPTTCIAETFVVYREFPTLGTNKHGWSNAYVNPNSLNSSILFIYSKKVEIDRPLRPTMYSIGSRSYVEHCRSYDSIQFQVAIPINVQNSTPYLKAVDKESSPR